MSGFSIPETPLTPQQRNFLEEVANLARDPYRRVARIILLYDAGNLTHQVAKEAGISRSRARYWHRQFKLKSLNLFPPDVIQTIGETAKAALVSLPLEAMSVEAVGSNQPSLPIKRKKKIQPKPPKEVISQEVEFPYPQPMKQPGIDPSDTMAEAGRKTWLFHFAEMIRHEEGTCRGEDIEELHDMRVATRRMRAAFDIFADFFKPKAIKGFLKGLRATGRALGSVRDLDVFMEKAQNYLESIAPDSRYGLDPLLNIWQEQRTQNRETMIAFLKSQDYHSFKQTFNTFLQTPGAGVRTLSPDSENQPPLPNLVCQVAPVLVYTRFASVRAYDAILYTASISQLHALRIELKKFRYTLEYFREVLSEETKELIADLKNIQDHLGDLNDADVACQILNRFLEEWESNQIYLALEQRLSSEPIVAYLASRHAERHRLMTTFPEAWKYFNRLEFRKNLAKAIATL